MTNPETMSTTQILAELAKSAERTAELQRLLVEHAKQQEAFENAYNVLVVLAKEGIDLLGELNFNDSIDDQWKDRADALVERVQPLLQGGKVM